MTAPSGASEPRRTARPPYGCKGSSSERRTSGRKTSAPAKDSDTGSATVCAERSSESRSTDMSARNPARRIGTAEDVAGAVVYALTSTFLTGQTLHIDGGEPLT